MFYNSVKGKQDVKRMALISDYKDDDLKWPIVHFVVKNERKQTLFMSAKFFDECV